MPVINRPTTKDALDKLFHDGLIKPEDFATTDEKDIFEMTREAWHKLALENRPCTWCGKLMGYEVDPCTKDLCMDCAHPDGGDC